jgi:RHS repeat-associated protein
MYADEGLIAEFDGSGSQTKAYGFAPNSTWTTDPLFINQGGQYYFYQNDHLGAPQKMTNASGAIGWSATYEAFGKGTVGADSTVTNNLRFPGQYYDQETGLHYNWNRFYDPKTGRYITADPIGLKGGINLFSYVSNNPINGIDSLGLCNKECPYCPGGEWASFSKLAVSAFWGGGFTLARTTYTCKSNGKKCSATAFCFGGGIIAAGGIGIDAGGFPGAERGVTDTYCRSDFGTFSSGVYVTAGPVSETHTGNSSNIGISKSWGLGIAFVTCKNFLIICDE